jgi:hypothetical protein
MVSPTTKPSATLLTRLAQLFTALSETLHNQLKLVTNEKHELAEEANHLITQIKQMQQSLDGTPQDAYTNSDIKVTYPLKPCLQALKEKHNTVAKLHRERYTQVKSKLSVYPGSNTKPSAGTKTKPQSSPKPSNPTLRISSPPSAKYSCRLLRQMHHVLRLSTCHITTLQLSMTNSHVSTTNTNDDLPQSKPYAQR